MEDFNLDLTLDEAAEARIAHAEFLNKIKEYGAELSEVARPVVGFAEALLEAQDSGEEVNYDIVQRIFPSFIKEFTAQINELYTMMQREAIKVLGSPFQIHTEHQPKCDGTSKFCGHQDHFMDGTNNG